MEKQKFEVKKEFFEKIFKECLDENFDKINHYLQVESVLFSELNAKIFEICKCIMCNSYNASITLTNHVLERLLKLALIANETGIEPVDANLWNDHFEQPHKNYTDKTLGNTIELCKKHDLISQQEKDYLFDKVREQIRNGFSHSDSDKILVENEEFTTMFKVSLTNLNDITPVKMNLKNIPILQSIQMEDFAKENAIKYFDFVFTLISNIENKLYEKFKK